VQTIDIFLKTLHFVRISFNQANDIYAKIYKKTACDVTRKRETSKLVYIFGKYEIPTVFQSFLSKIENCEKSTSLVASVYRVFLK
jgi:hypothetical protein